MDECYIDFFNNGNLLVGFVYVNGIVGSGSYFIYGIFVVGVEFGGVDIDWFG